MGKILTSKAEILSRPFSRDWQLLRPVPIRFSKNDEIRPALLYNHLLNVSVVSNTVFLATIQPFANN